MALEREVLVSPTAEVPVVEGEVVIAIRALADCGLGSKAIARAAADFREGDQLTGERSVSSRIRCLLAPLINCASKRQQS